MPEQETYDVPNVPELSAEETGLLRARRLEKIAKVGEHTVFPNDQVQVAEFMNLPIEWPTTPHIVRGPANICGSSLIAVKLETKDGPVFFPVPPVIADLLGAAYDKGLRTAQRTMRRALGIAQ